MFRYFFVAILIFCTQLKSEAITYEFSGGRFGDNLLAYLHAKYISYKYNLPLLYKPFKYSSELLMHDLELPYDIYKKRYVKELKLSKTYPVPFVSRYLFVCPYFPEVEWELIKDKQYYTFAFQTDWKNKEFRELATKMISLKNNRLLTWPPQGIISIAIHMREGGGYDDEEYKLKNPLKAPPVTFYIDGLKKILDMFPNQPIYCHLFTDALDPQSWINRILLELPANHNITFNFREKNNNPDSNVLEDFFSLFNFDILIRAESNYSIVPSLIHDYAVVCYPKTFKINGKTAVIDSINYEINEELCKKLLF